MDMRPDGTNGTNLSEVGDITGRALDVVLRRRFEGKGGMGAYSDPQSDHPLHGPDGVCGSQTRGPTGNPAATGRSGAAHLSLLRSVRGLGPTF